MSQHALTLALVRTAIAIADQEAVTLVESEALRLSANTTPAWFDVSVLFNNHEFSPATQDLHAARLAYGLARGVLGAHPNQAHLLRIVRRPRLAALLLAPSNPKDRS